MLRFIPGPGAGITGPGSGEKTLNPGVPSPPLSLNCLSSGYLLSIQSKNQTLLLFIRMRIHPLHGI